MNFWQLTVKPSADTVSELHTTSTFGPFELKCQRNCMRSAKPSTWSECMCVKKTALICAGGTLSCDRRIVVPRPESNCSFTAAQLLLSSPYRTRVPEPANPLYSGGPPIVPVSVTIIHGAALAIVGPKMADHIQAHATSTNAGLIIGASANAIQEHAQAECRFWSEADIPPI